MQDALGGAIKQGTGLSIMPAAAAATQLSQLPSSPYKSPHSATAPHRRPRGSCGAATDVKARAANACQLA